MSIVWVLVADRGRAKVFHMLPEVQPSFLLLAEFEHPESRQPAQAFESDSPGRIQLRGASRSAVEPHTDLAHLTARKFARELAEYLDSACRENRFEKLVIVAPPLFLGTLRRLLSPPLKQRIAFEVDKDLTACNEPELQKHLVQLMQTASLSD